MSTEKVILYFTDDGISVFDWDDKVLISHTSFDINDEHSSDKFQQFIETHLKVPFYIMINSVEEEYKLDTMPYVARKKQILLDRYVNRNYRGNTFKFGEIQGREQNGDKQNQILVSAISNEERLKSWVDILLKHKCSIAGIYSLPLLTEKLVEKIPIVSKKLLVVTFDQNGLRLSYLAENKFKISRLAKLELDDTSQTQSAINDEIDKTLRYLGRMRLVFPDQKPDMLLIAPNNICKPFQDNPSENIKQSGIWHIWNSEFLCNSLKSSSIEDKSVVTDLYMQILLTSKTKDHYATHIHTRYFRSRNFRKPLTWSSVAFFVMLFIFSGIMLIDAHILDLQLEKSNQNIKLVESKLTENKKKLPDFPVPADTVRSGVESVNVLLTEQPDLKGSLISLSKTLSQFSNININYLHWSVQKREIIVEKIESAEPEEFDDPTEMADVDVNEESAKKWVKIITLQGNLVNFKGNYAAANHVIDNLVNSIAASKAFHSVIATQKPINQKPEKRITGVAGNRSTGDNLASFSLEIITRDAKLS